MTTTTVLALLAVHFVADFVLQSDWMAQGESKALGPLLAHTAVYAACFVGWGLPFALITFVAHTATDAVTSRITSRLWFFERQAGVWIQAPYTAPKHNREIVNPWMPVAGSQRHWFFVVIGADQLLHHAQLLLTYGALYVAS